MQTEMIALDRLSQDPANVRVHDARNLDSIKSSLRRFGQMTPIVVDADGIIRKGNGTYRAAVALGWETIEVVRTALSGSEATAYAIADNRTSDLSDNDDVALAAQLDAIRSEDEDLARAAGYESGEIDALLERLAADAAGEKGTLPPPEEAAEDWNPAIRYELVFDDVDQQGRWFQFLRRLKLDVAYEAAETVAGKLDLHLRAEGLTA